MLDWLTDLAKPKSAPTTYPEEREIGWWYPEHLVRRGLLRFLHTGQLPLPEEIEATPLRWEQDIFDMYDLYRYASNTNALLALAGPPPKDAT